MSPNSIKREVAMSAGVANLFGLIFLLPIFLFMGIPYYLIWPEQFTLVQFKSYFAARDALTVFDIVIGFMVLFFGIVTHELLHGIGWSFYTKKGWKSIRFGIEWKYLTPYCHCAEILPISAYRFGSVLPAMVLGILPSIIAIVSGNLMLMVFGFIFTFAAGGDFLILWMLRKEKLTVFVQDHPDKIGCLVIQNPSI